MRRSGVLALVALAWARTASAQTVKPSDFDPSRLVLDEQVLSRVKANSRAGFRALEAEPSPAPAPKVFSLSRGTITVAENWTSDPTTGEDVLHGRVEFAPGPNAPDCRSVRLIQAARVETAPGRDLDWAEGQQNRNLIRTEADPAHGVLPGYFIDHDATKCSAGAPCSPYYRDSWANPDESADGSSGAAGARPASLADYPFGWDLFESITLETCARCVDTGEFLGCADWGAQWPQIGNRTLRAPAAAEAPSATFLDALRRFDDFYAVSP